MLIKPHQKLVFMGDSVTDCDRAKPEGEGLFGALGNGYVANIAAMLTSAYPELHARVVNKGISGNNVRDLRSRWQTDLISLKPDWAFVMIGINDVWRQFDSPEIAESHVSLEEYEGLLDALIAQAHAHIPHVVMLTPYVMEPNRGDAMRARMDEYGAAAARVASRYGLMLIDIQAAFDALFEHMHPMNIAWDRIHPNAAGHMLIARCVLAALGFDR